MQIKHKSAAIGEDRKIITQRFTRRKKQAGLQYDGGNKHFHATNAVSLQTFLPYNY